MKKIVFFIFFLLGLTAFSNNPKKIIVTLSLGDCAKCTIALYQINDLLYNPEMTFVFEEDLEPDSLLVYKKSGIDYFKSGIVKYSDDLFKEYSNGVYSTINIVENNKTVYSKVLLELDINEFISAYFNKNSCFDNLKKGKNELYIIQDDNTLLSLNRSVERWSYYDQNTTREVIADDVWVKKAYDIYYNSKENAESHYNRLQTVREQPMVRPMTEPKIMLGKKINNNELLFLTTIEFLEDNETEDISIFTVNFFVTYNIKEDVITSMKYVNAKPLNDKEYAVNNIAFHIIGDEYIIPLITPVVTPEKKYLSVFEVNKSNPNELVLKEILNPEIPGNFIKYNIMHNFNSYNFHQSLILLNYGGIIYDYKKEAQYRIPFPESEYNTLENIFDVMKTKKWATFFIYDIFDNDQTILLLYKDAKLKNLNLMEIDKKTEKAINETVLLTASELENYNHDYSFSFDNNGKIQYLDNNNNCIVEL